MADKTPQTEHVVADSDTFKGTPAHGVTTVKFGPEGSAGDLRGKTFGSISIAEQNKRAKESTTPPALRTPEGAQAARAGFATPAAATPTPATGSTAPAPTPTAPAAAPRAPRGGVDLSSTP